MVELWCEVSLRCSFNQRWVMMESVCSEVSFLMRISCLHCLHCAVIETNGLRRLLRYVDKHQMEDESTSNTRWCDVHCASWNLPECLKHSGWVCWLINFCKPTEERWCLSSMVLWVNLQGLPSTSKWQRNNVQKPKSVEDKDRLVGFQKPASLHQLNELTEVWNKINACCLYKMIKEKEFLHSCIQKGA